LADPEPPPSPPIEPRAPIPDPPHVRRARQWLGIALILLITAVSFWLAVNPRWVMQAGQWSYVGAFVISMVASATIILPAPGAAIVVAMGTTLNPFVLGIAAGAGSAVGELTGYVAGATGRALVEEHQHVHYRRIHGLTRKYGPLLLFAFSAIPVPFFDLAGIVAGALRMRIASFLTAIALGKSIKYIVLILVGAELFYLAQEWLLQFAQ